MGFHRLRYLALAPVLCLGLSLAAPVPLEKALQTLNTANREVIVAMPVIRVYAVAEKLRILMVERHVRVIGLTQGSSVCDAGSYWEALRRAGMKLRAINRVTGYEIIVDRKYHLAGDELGRDLGPDEPFNLELQRGEIAAQKASQALKVWNQGTEIKCIKEE